MQKSFKKYIIMTEENITQEFRLKNLDETRNDFIEKINQNELMSKNHKKFGGFEIYGILTYFCFCSYWMCFIFAVASLVGIHVGITSSTAELTICIITTAIKKYKSIIIKK